MICEIELHQIPEVVRVHALAFPGYMNTRLGGLYLREFIKWFCNSDSSIAICAMDEDRIVGYAIGAPQGYSKAVTRSMLWITAVSLLVRPWLWVDCRIIRAIAQRIGLIKDSTSGTNMPELPLPVYSLVGLGVLPDSRGRRIGWKLIKTFEDQVWQKQFKSLKLTVYRQNDARAFYERSSWLPYDFSADSPTVMYYKIVS
jgi:GNAT superfamily N-acetyltransferase